MKLCDLIFVDGRITSFEMHGAVLAVSFVDYADNKIEIRFQGHVEFINNDGIGHDFADSRLTSNGNAYKLELMDDEGQSAFTVMFESAEYY